MREQRLGFLTKRLEYCWLGGTGRTADQSGGAELMRQLSNGLAL